MREIKAIAHHRGGSAMVGPPQFTPARRAVSLSAKNFSVTMKRPSEVKIPMRVYVPLLEFNRFNTPEL